MRLLTVVATAGLCGCGLAQQAQLEQLHQQSQASLQADLSACKSRYPGLVKGQAADSLRCSNAAYERNAQALPGNNKDLISLAGAKSVAAAERFDNGQITKAELDVELAQIYTEFSSGSQNRTHQMIAAESAAQQAAAARHQAAMQGMAAGAAIMSGGLAAPPARAPFPQQTNCTTFGRNTNCTTW